jgi:hypothetical protein
MLTEFSAMVAIPALTYVQYEEAEKWRCSWRLDSAILILWVQRGVFAYGDGVASVE